MTVRARQNIISKFLAFFMAVTVAITNVPVAQVYAEEKPADRSAMKYVVIAQPQVTTPGNQNVVVGLDDSSCATDATLTYRNNTTGQVLKQTATKMIPGAILFTMDYSDAKQKGEYELLSVTCKVEDVDYTMSMSELNIDARYGVNQQVQTTPDGVVVEEAEENGSQRAATYKGAPAAKEQSSDIEIVTMDGNGKVTSENSIAEAITSAERNLEVRGRGKELVVVLDPGHGGYDGGAQGNGLSEKNLNLAIAKYCKAELEKYQNVKVYMTRTDDVFVKLSDRAALAKNWGADVFVSIHINSSTNATAGGAEVWYPNPTGNLNIHNEGAKLAQTIEDQLVALGLGNRGIHYRNYSYDWSVDQNIGDADYYAVIRESKAYGFPGVIVEHAFISNPNDAANYLGNDTVLKKLGVADATGIAKAYGLSREPQYTKKDTTVTAKLNGSQTKVTLTATGLKKAGGVRFAVYSEKNGTDDLRWYTAKMVNGVWTARAKIINHKSSGKYRVKLYVTPSNGSKYYVTGKSFTVSAPSVAGRKVTDVNNAKGTFKVQSTVKAKSGVKKVQVAVWRKSNKSDLRWYTAKLQKDGTYRATIHNKNFGDYYGTYNYRVKATDNNDNSVTTKTKTYKLEKSKVKWSVKDKSSYTKKQVLMSNVPYAENTQKVRIKVWSEEKGQSYTKTYNAKKKSDGSWYANVNISDFKKAGKYRVTGYAILRTGKQKSIGSKTFTVNAASANSVRFGTVNAVEGKVKITESIASKAPVEKVQVVAWSAGDKSDKRTYTAKRGMDGQYSATINIKNHDYHYGKYRIYTYVTDKNGIKVLVDKRTKTITKPVPTMQLVAENNATRERTTISNVPYGKRVKQVKYRVWSEANGQDDAKWYTANKVKTGQYAYTIPLINHIDTGKIRVDAYAYYTDGKKEKLLTKRFSIDLYSVAGPSNTNAAQLVRYYNANASYPEFYAGSDAPNIETFAQIYIEECNAEGIRAEVAFAQAMKETGFLRYGGRVPVEAYNFAGLGAIDSDVTAYATFGNVREGVRAQVQHLKAYANQDALKNPCVDGRFSLVTRGTAPYVEWLGINENPYGKGWATALRYGYSLRDDYMAKLLRY